MTLGYVRDTYRVPAKRGGRVLLGQGFGPNYAGRFGTIASADHRLRVRLDGDRSPTIVHPTWEITYL